MKKTMLFWSCLDIFGLLFKYTYVPTIFATSIRKKCTRLKWTIYKNESDKNNNCLSVDNFGILSLVVCYYLWTLAHLQPSPAYVEV